MTTHLRLTREGPGSYLAILEYMASVIQDRTTVNADVVAVDETPANRLARGMLYSILHRLGADTAICRGEPEEEKGIVCILCLKLEPGARTHGIEFITKYAITVKDGQALCRDHLEFFKWPHTSLNEAFSLAWSYLITEKNGEGA